jgi:hypothetical protein
LAIALLKMQGPNITGPVDPPVLTPQKKLCGVVDIAYSLPL